MGKVNDPGYINSFLKAYELPGKDSSKRVRGYKEMQDWFRAKHVPISVRTSDEASGDRFGAKRSQGGRWRMGAGARGAAGGGAVDETVGGQAEALRQVLPRPRSANSQHFTGGVGRQVLTGRAEWRRADGSSHTADVRVLRDTATTAEELRRAQPAGATLLSLKVAGETFEETLAPSLQTPDPTPYTLVESQLISRVESQGRESVDSCKGRVIFRKNKALTALFFTIHARAESFSLRIGL